MAEALPTDSDSATLEAQRAALWEHPLAPLCLAGPTGSGKSALAVKWAMEQGGEIVNVDAYQIYQGLPILTAQPSAEERAAVPHHLYHLLPLTDLCNAGRYFRLAIATLQSLQARGVRPLLVGGNGLYLKTLTHGLNELPTAQPELRAELEALSPEDAVQRLLMLDPHAGASINLQNPRFVQRALEISLLTGKPASELKSAWKQPSERTFGYFLNPPREVLYERINLRCRQMLNGGAIEEVAALDTISATATKAIGVAEIQSYLRGEMSRQTLEETISQATRRYAKRQLTWFRNQANLVPYNPLG